MSLFADQYAVYVIVAYAASATILAALIWASVSSGRRARRELDGLERERRR